MHWSLVTGIMYNGAQKKDMHSGIISEYCNNHLETRHSNSGRLVAVEVGMQRQRSIYV
jgi:hypothetical protein